MKAILLAAGVGSRLRPITNEKPKTLVKVNGKPMLHYLIENLKENNIKDIVICTGYKSEMIVNYCKKNFTEIDFTFVENKNYDKTNNMYSFYLAKKYFIGQEFILMNTDLVFGPKVIEIIKSKTGSIVAVDKNSFDKESMKIIVNKEKNIKSISKQIGEEESYGCSIDVYKIDKNDSYILIEEMKRIIEQKGDQNSWTEVMLDNLFKSGKLNAKTADINPEKWYEIDNYEDLSKAELIFNQNISKLKDKKIFFFDRDGTLTIGKNLLPGAKEIIKSLKEKDKIIYVLTNNSSKIPKEHHQKLSEVGLELEQKEILVSIQPTIEFMKEKGYKKIFWSATKKVGEYIKNQGLILEKEVPEAILLTFNTEIEFKDLEIMTHLIRKGLPYYATHPDMLCPTKKGLIPDIGCFIEIIKIATERTPDKIFGKPNIDMIKPILKKHNLKEKDAVIFGDRLYTDIKLAQETDITSILVLSGETNREDYEYSDYKADIIVKDLKKILNYIN